MSGLLFSLLNFHNLNPNIGFFVFEISSQYLMFFMRVDLYIRVLVCPLFLLSISLFSVSPEKVKKLHNVFYPFLMFLLVLEHRLWIIHYEWIQASFFLLFVYNFRKQILVGIISMRTNENLESELLIPNPMIDDILGF